MLAYAVAAQLESVGLTPAGLVLVDTYMGTTSIETLPQVFEQMFKREEAFATIKDAGLMAMSIYSGLVSEWAPMQILTPVLLVRATQPMAGTPADGQWRTSLDFTHTAVDVPGDHFTVLEAHADSTAQAVQEWVLDLTPVMAGASDM